MTNLKSLEEKKNREEEVEKLKLMSGSVHDFDSLMRKANQISRLRSQSELSVVDRELEKDPIR